MPDVRKIVPEWSRREPGEHLLMAPISRFGPIAAMELVESIVNHHLIYRNKEGAWSFILRPMGSSGCRLVFRGTWKPGRSLVARLGRVTLFDPMHYLMEWKMARTIKELAESNE
jgi:hypothetical protein